MQQIGHLTVTVAGSTENRSGVPGRMRKLTGVCVTLEMVTLWQNHRIHQHRHRIAQEASRTMRRSPVCTSGFAAPHGTQYPLDTP
eukprot:1928098-Rhodomonas_salina.1